jgi:hypothetical protein
MLILVDEGIVLSIMAFDYQGTVDNNDGGGMRAKA